MHHCPHCTSSDLVHIRIALTGAPVLFAHCRACEHRWWTDLDGSARMPLADVLTRAAA